jgi:glycosyltransferase involved in cell wall biosynthesis
LFRHLIRQGHEVRVFCSCYAPVVFRGMYDKPFPVGVSELEGGVVHRLPSKLLPRNLVLCKAVPEAVREFQPDMTFVSYITSWFGWELFYDRSIVPGALFGSFGEHTIQRHTTLPWPMPWFKNTVLDSAFYLLKRRLVRKCIELSDAALCVTPDTIDYIVGRAIPKPMQSQLAKRCALYPLGFDPEIFYPNDASRESQRKALGLSEDHIVLLHAGKITPVKQLDIWVNAVCAAMQEVPQLRAIFIGFADGNTESDRIRSLIELSGFGERFICRPFLPRQQLAALYNAADLGAWFWAASVSIQEAMGTGLYMLLNNSPTTSHLLLPPQTGRYFPEYQYDQLRQLIIETARAVRQDRGLLSFQARVQRFESNRRRFGSDVLARRLVSAALDPANAVALVEGDLPWASRTAR